MAVARRLRWIRVLAVAGFLVHATTYLYFFVDDEAIPYVYAQNLLDGRGLVYSLDDGRVEGFSDLLHVGLATVILAITRALHLPVLTVFPIGKAICLLAGCGVLWVAGRMLERLRMQDAAVHVAALAFLAVAGPLAVWSCSSLEAVPFALGLAVLVYALVGEQVLSAPAAFATVFLMLERSDGFVWVGAVAGAFWLLRPGEARRSISWNVLLPGVVAGAGVELFRLVYYQDWLPMPVFAKVLFKLHDNGQLVEKRPEVSYAMQFVRAYGRWPLAVGGLMSLVAVVRYRALRPLAVAVVLLAVYASVVGDWMFGFRFFVPLLAPVAVLLGAAVAGVARPLAWVAAVAIAAQSAITAHAFEHSYVAQPNETPRQNFWKTRSLSADHFFRPEYDLLQALRPLVRPHEHISYNQAGLIPFALDLENVDTLGICSRYYAELPARDVIYTEVGRYEPFTEAPVVTARGAYLLTRAPDLIVDSTIPLRRVNAGVVPPAILAGHYAISTIDASGLKAIYRRTGQPAEEYRRGPDSFLINLAHVAYVKRATAGSEVLTGRGVVDGLPFLRGEHVLVSVDDKSGWQIMLGNPTAVARYLYIGAIRAERPGILHVTLRAPDGRAVLRAEVAIDRQYRMWSAPLSPPSGVAEMELELIMDDARRQPVYLADVRLMGQTPELRAFVSSQVRFDRTR